MSCDLAQPSGAGITAYIRCLAHVNGMRTCKKQCGGEGAKMEAMVAEFEANRIKIRELQGRNAELTEIFDAKASFKDGSKTGHLICGDADVVVTRRVNESWDQAKLAEAKAVVGDDTFNYVFRPEYKPCSKEVFTLFMDKAPSEVKKPILAALTTKLGKPSVEIKELAK